MSTLPLFGTSNAEHLAKVSPRSKQDGTGVNRAPALSVLADFELLHARSGHENAGFLSRANGFVPRVAPLLRLPAEFAAWDQLASELPSLHRSLGLRKRVAELPVLDASEQSLGETYLLRACALLAMVSHAYWYVETRPPLELPEPLRRPWAQLRERLERTQEVVSYIDLVVYNWRQIDATHPDPFVVENLELLFPTFGSREERVFYLTQLEILARMGPAVSLLAEAQDAALRDSPMELRQSLGRISDCLRLSTRQALPKIDPRERSATHVNPVIWAKTVAPFAVPFGPGLQGPSGTSSPIFNALDLFFGRKRFDSFLGREILSLRASYPPAWRSFLVALTVVSVADYVARCKDAELEDAFSEALALYAGADGFLGRHRLKVYGYLELAFKVGRSLTIGGFEGVFTDRTWDEVDDALRAARHERLDLPARDALFDRSQVTARQSDAGMPRYTLSEVARHNDARHGYWLVLEGEVYDLTDFVARHPGGPRVLQGYAGLDATAGFLRAHRGHTQATALGSVDGPKSNIDSLRARYRIGLVQMPRLSGHAVTLENPSGTRVTMDCAALYRSMVSALSLVVEMQNALRADHSLQHQALSPGDVPGQRTPYKLSRALQTHGRFVVEYLGVLVQQTLPGVWAQSHALLFAHDAADWMRSALAEPEIHGLAEHCAGALSKLIDGLATSDEHRIAAIADRLEQIDHAYLAGIKAHLIATVSELETNGSEIERLRIETLRGALQQCALATHAYFRELWLLLQ